MSRRRDQALSEADEGELREHLSLCLNCRRFDAQLDALSALAKRFAAGTKPPSA